MRNFNARAGVVIEDSLSTSLLGLAPAIRAAAEEAVLAGGHIIRTAAYENANVSPGVLGNGVGGEHMRDEIKVDVIQYESGVQSKVGIDLSIIPYAPHQEFGPHGNAFMTRAVDETRPQVHQAMREVLAERLGDIAGTKTSVRFRRFA